MASYRSMKNQAAFLSSLQNVLETLTKKPQNVNRKRIHIIPNFMYDREEGTVNINYRAESFTDIKPDELLAIEELVIAAFENAGFEVVTNNSDLYGIYPENIE